MIKTKFLYTFKNVIDEGKINFFKNDFSVIDLLLQNENFYF